VAKSELERCHRHPSTADSGTARTRETGTCSLGAKRAAMEAAAERAFKSQCPCHRPHMNLYCAEWRAFGNFFHALSTLKEDKRQRLVPAYGAGRWASKTGCTPASPTRAYKECARHFVTFPIDEFRTSCIDHELGCTLQTLEMEKCQISPDDIKKCGVLTAQRMILRARFTNSLRALPLTAHTHTNQCKDS